MLINIAFYVSTAVLCNKKYLNVIKKINNFAIFYNKFIETDLRLVDERCVTSFHGNLQIYL